MKKLKVLLLTVLVALMFTSCSTLRTTGYTDEGNGVYSKYDPFNDITTYCQELTLDYYADPPMYVDILVSNKAGRFTFLGFEYKGSSWIFFDSAILMNGDGGKMTFSLDSPSRNVRSGGYVTERDSVNVTDEMRASLLTLLNGSNVRLRLSGKSYKEYTLSQEQIDGIKTMLNYQL